MAIGKVGWVDLTVADAPGVRDFYKAVVGWETSEVPMGDYADFCVHPPGEDPVGGICHARGKNASQPPVWMVYIEVASLDESLEKVKALGGELLVGPRKAGPTTFAVIRDPAGAICSLIQVPAATG